MSDAFKKRKIAVLGSRSVGKTSLLRQFIEHHFEESYYPTIESTFYKRVVYKGFEYDCRIIDTAGLDEYSPINSEYTIGIHGYILVYSITSRNSFNMIQIMHDKIVDFCGVSKPPCVIVASKADLSMSRQVGVEDLVELAEQNGCAWIETSARHVINVGKVFELCLNEIEKTTASTGRVLVKPSPMRDYISNPPIYPLSPGFQPIGPIPIPGSRKRESDDPKTITANYSPRPSMLASTGISLPEIASQSFGLPLFEERDINVPNSNMVYSSESFLLAHGPAPEARFSTDEATNSAEARPFDTPSTSVYSAPYSRTASTDYGMYYRRMGLSQETNDEIANTKG